MNLIECPECRSTRISMYELRHLMRRYDQDEDGIDFERYDEEVFKKDEPFTFRRQDCEHEWLCDDDTEIDDLL